MKAIRIHQFGGPEVLQVENVPDPIPGKGEVVVQIDAIGINPVETYIRAGTYGPREFPFTPGMDAAGTVIKVGEGVTHVKSGDRVYIDASLTGTYAEQALCREAQVHLLPDDITFDQGAAIGVPYVTAYRALIQRGEARAGESVLVHGATGGVGLASVQIALALGLTVIATGGSKAGRMLLAEQGATHILDHHQDGYLERVKEITNGKGVDIILEMAAHINLGKDLGVLAQGGRVIVIGSRGPIEINPRDTMIHDADIRGMSGPGISEADRASIHAAIGAGLRNGTLRPIVSQQFALTEAAQAHEAVMDSSHGARGKIVLKP
jgi:NADPH2:quinone reductase